MPQLLKNIFQMALIMGLLFSCATKPKKTKTTYSDSTNAEFMDLEKQQAIESYRLMRLRDMQNKKKRSSKRRYYKRVKPKRRVVRKPPPPPKPKPLTQEKIMEINQNLAYFCMKNRKHPRYGNEDICKDHAQGKFEECKADYQKNPRINVVRCVKRKLNL